MSGHGRTSWWPCDGSEHDRELNVELGEEFGPAGPLVMRVMKDLAQQQRDDGAVRTGFRVLRGKAHLEDPALAREIVEKAAAIGALDDLEVDRDGRRFTCRVSGWLADQARGRAAIKKADQRRFSQTPSDPVPSEGDTSSGEGTCPVVSPLDNKTLEVPPVVPQGGRDRDRKAFEENVRAYAQTLPIDNAHPDAWHQVRAAIAMGARTTDAVLDFFREWRPDLLAGEEVAA